jgi:hypothetical protein
VRCVYVRWAYNSAHVYTADSAFNVTAVACALAAELRVVCAQRIGSTAKLYTVTLYPVSLEATGGTTQLPDRAGIVQTMDEFCIRKTQDIYS